MTKKSLLSFMKYVSLSILGMIAVSGYILADTFFVSAGLGTEGLTALSLALPAYNLVYGVSLMLGVGAATRFAYHKSQGETAEANSVFTHALAIGGIFAAALVIVALTLSAPLARLLGADEHVFDMTNTYLKVLILFSPAFVLKELLLCFVRNDGAPKLSMAAMVISSFSNILLDYLFIFPCNMGIFGAVLATGLSPIIGIAVLSFHFIRRKNTFRLIKTAPKFSVCGKIMSIGVPSLITQFSAGISMIVFNLLILNLAGNVGTAAYSVVANISFVVVSVFTGIEQGMQPLLSSAYGSGDEAMLREYLRYGVVTVFLVTALLTVALYIPTEQIVSVFNRERNVELTAYAVRGMRLYFSATVCVGLSSAVSVFFSSTQKPFPAQIISLLRGLAVLLPVVLIFSRLFGMTGIWLSYPVTETLVCIVAIVFLFVFYHPSKSVKE